MTLVPMEPARPDRGGTPILVLPPDNAAGYVQEGMLRHPMPSHLRVAWVAIVPASREQMPRVVRRLVAEAGLELSGPEPTPRGQHARAKLERTVRGMQRSTMRTQIYFAWLPLGDDRGHALAWRHEVTDHPSRLAAREDISYRVAQVLFEGYPIWGPRQRPRRRMERDPVVGPGGRVPAPGGRMGELRDYSRAGTWPQVAELRYDGALPLGRYLNLPKLSHGWPQRGSPGSRLYLPESLETRSVLICAPPGAGKTHLMLEWARTAMLAGRSVLMVDVKGNVHGKLQERLGRLPPDRRPVFHRFATSSKIMSSGSVRLNFLAEIDYGSDEGLDQMEQLAQAIVPDRGYAGEASDNYRFRLRLCRALIGIACLSARYLRKPSRLVPGAARDHDMSDVLALAASEQELCLTICRILARESAIGERGGQPVTPTVDKWFADVAAVVPHATLQQAWDLVRAQEEEGARLPEVCPLRGQTHPQYGYALYTANLQSALDLFREDRALYRVLSGDKSLPGAGQRMRVADLFGAKPVMLLVESASANPQEQDTILSMLLALATSHLSARFGSESANRLLFLLDETRRIRGFQAERFVTFMREANAGAVLVYQNLQQIADDAAVPSEGAVHALLGSVGSLIFLQEVRGQDYRYLNELLGPGERSTWGRTTQRDHEGHTTSTWSPDAEQVPVLEQRALRQFPGYRGALVLLRGYASGAPFFTELNDPDADGAGGNGER